MSTTTRTASALGLAASLVLGPALSAPASPARASREATARTAGTQGVTAAAVERANAEFTMFAKAPRLSGSVLIAQGNTVLLRKGYGMADWSHQIPYISATEFIDYGLSMESEERLSS